MIFNVHVCVGVGHNTSLCIVPKTPTEKIFWWQGKHNYSVASFFIEGENTMFEIIRSEENSLKTSGACVCQFSESLGVKLIFFFGLLSVHMMLNNQCSLGPFLIFLLILVPHWLWKKKQNAAASILITPPFASTSHHPIVIVPQERHKRGRLTLEHEPISSLLKTMQLAESSALPQRKLYINTATASQTFNKTGKKERKKRKGNARHTSWSRQFVHLLAADTRSTRC